VNPQRISFARTLPILALLLSYVIIAVPATMIYVNLEHASRGSDDVIIQHGQFQIIVPHDHILRSSLTAAEGGASHTVQAINLPGHFIEFAIGKFTAQPGTWSLFHLDFLAWRALTFPTCCLPFWWLAGVGLDGMSGDRRLRWWIFVPSLILWVLFLLFIVGFYFDSSPLEREEAVYPIWSFWLWSVLLTAFPIALVKQWLARRRIRANLQARLTAELQ
jgi:hypothetical protein